MADKTTVETEFIPGYEQHITESFLNAKFGDEQSIRIRGELRSLELFLLQEFQRFSSMEHTVDMIRSFKASLESEIDKSDGGMDKTEVVVPHATTPNKNDSYQTVPLKVAQACAEAMKRNNCITPEACPVAKKKKNNWTLILYNNNNNNNNIISITRTHTFSLFIHFWLKWLAFYCLK